MDWYVWLQLMNILIIYWLATDCRTSRLCIQLQLCCLIPFQACQTVGSCGTKRTTEAWAILIPLQLSILGNLVEFWKAPSNWTTWIDTLSAPLGLLNTNTLSVLNFSLICCLIRFKLTKTVGSKEPRNNRTIQRQQWKESSHHGLITRVVIGRVSYTLPAKP